MKNFLWLLTLSMVLFGCGSDSENAQQTDDWDDDEELAFEQEEEAGNFGTITIGLPEDSDNDGAACTMNLTRIPDNRLVNVIFTFDVFGKGCDGMGQCDNPNMQGGDINYSGGIDGDKPFATMFLNYIPPSDSEAEVMWMYNAIYKTEPFSRFDMLVDGEPFNVLTSDTRGAEDLANGPHVWNTRIEIEADMVQSKDVDDQSAPGLQVRGNFVYEGPCEVFAKNMDTL